MKKILFVLLMTVMTASIFFGVFSSCKKNNAASGSDSLKAMLSRGEFVIGLDDSFPPMGFRNEDNEIVGFDIDLAKEVAARLNVKFRAQPIDWSAKEQELATGKIDCIWNGLTITEERKKALTFSKAYLDNEQVLVVRADSGITSLSDMTGKTVGLQSGSSASDALEESVNFKGTLKSVVEFKENITALNDLEMGGVDAILMDSIVANYSIKQTGKPFVVLNEALATEEYGIAFRQGDVELEEKVQATLEEMAEDGTVDSISSKWFGSNITVIGR